DDLRRTRIRQVLLPSHSGTLDSSSTSLKTNVIHYFPRRPMNDYFHYELVLLETHALKFAGADDIVQVMQPSSRRISMKIVFVMLFRFQLISSGAQLGRSGI
uniref:Uncharacterized protein n=1 Tax=Triticum urartu TaxID=4572 RepID=A0A8R7TEY5_TRIUA